MCDGMVDIKWTVLRQWSCWAKRVWGSYLRDLNLYREFGARVGGEGYWLRVGFASPCLLTRCVVTTIPALKRQQRMLPIVQDGLRGGRQAASVAYGADGGQKVLNRARGN